MDILAIDFDTTQIYIIIKMMPVKYALAAAHTFEASEITTFLTKTPQFDGTN